MNIVQMLMSEVVQKKKAPYLMKPTRIVVHNTANDASARNEITYMNKDNGNIVSFHFAVDDKEVVQGLPLNKNSFNAGDGANGKGNREGIAIEICYSKSGGARFIEAEKLSAKLVAKLLNDYNWGIDKITKHQDYSGKYCPHRTLDAGWQRYVNMCIAELDKLKKKDYTGQTVARDEFKSQIEVRVEQLIVRDKPTLKGDRLGYANKGIYNLTEKTSADGYTWYKLNDGIYAPSKDKWIVELEVKEPIVSPKEEPIIPEIEEKKEDPEEPIVEPIKKLNFLEVIKELIKWFINIFKKEK